MKSKLPVIFYLAIVALIADGKPLVHAADMWTTANTPTISHNAFPQLKGNALVWQARGGIAGAKSGSGDLEIFLLHIDRQVMIQVTDDDYDDISPQTDGEYLVWQKHHPSRGNQIYLYEIHEASPAGGKMISSNDGMDHCAPQIAAGRVVWTSQLVAQSFEPGQIMLYDARNLSGPDSISDHAFDCSSPRMDGETVVWTQSHGKGTAILVTYDLTSESPLPEPAPQGFVWQETLQTDGDLTVLTAHDGTDREILLYDASLKTYKQITDNDLEDSYPRISGTALAWVGDEGQAAEIYLSADVDMEPDNGEDEDPEEPDSPSGGGGGGGGSCFVEAASCGDTTKGAVYMMMGCLISAALLILFWVRRDQMSRQF